MPRALWCVSAFGGQFRAKHAKKKVASYWRRQVVFLVSRSQRTPCDVADPAVVRFYGRGASQLFLLAACVRGLIPSLILDVCETRLVRSVLGLTVRVVFSVFRVASRGVVSRWRCRPYLKAEWLKRPAGRGLHVNCIGADAPGKGEMEAAAAAQVI